MYDVYSVVGDRIPISVFISMYLERFVKKFGELNMLAMEIIYSLCCLCLAKNRVRLSLIIAPIMFGYYNYLRYFSKIACLRSSARDIQNQSKYLLITSLARSEGFELAVS